MSDSKPCPALEWIDSDRIHGLHEACANCPNRKPVSLQLLVERVLTKMDDRDTGHELMDDVGDIIREYEKELNQ